MRVNRRPGDGFDSLQLPRCGHVELLDEVVDDGHEWHDAEKNRRRVRDDNQNGHGIEEHHDPEAHRHRQHVVDDVDVL